MNIPTAPSLDPIRFVLDPEHVGNPDQDALLTEWHRLAVDRLPGRADFSPALLASGARLIAIYEHIPKALDHPRDYRFRFLGADLANIFGELTGRSVSEYLATAEWATRTMNACDKVVEARRPMQGLAESVAHDSKKFMRNDALFLPLSTDGKTVSSVLAHYWISYRMIG